MLYQKYDGTFYGMIGYGTQYENGKPIVILRNVQTNELLTVTPSYFNGHAGNIAEGTRLKRFTRYVQTCTN